MRGREAETEKKIKGEEGHVQGGWMPECLTGTNSLFQVLNYICMKLRFNGLLE